MNLLSIINHLHQNHQHNNHHQAFTTQSLIFGIYGILDEQSFSHRKSIYFKHINHLINHHLTYDHKYTIIIGYHAIFKQFIKVRLVSQSSTIFTLFIKNQVTYSYGSL